MENKEAPTPIDFNDLTKPNIIKILESKTYEMKIKDKNYFLTIELLSNQKLNFHVKQINDFSLFYYKEEFEYKVLIEKLFLSEKYYNNIAKIFNFLDMSVLKNKVSLILEKNHIKLSLKKTMDYDEIVCFLNLNEIKIKNEEIIEILFNEIQNLKLRNNMNQKDEIIENLIKEKEEIKAKLDSFIIESRKEKEEINHKIYLLIEENKELKKMINKNLCNIENIIKYNDIYKININYEKCNFKENPCLLKFKKFLSKEHKSEGLLSNFAVYKGLYDNKEYLVYSKKNFELYVMNINDNTILNKLLGHKDFISIIRYYINDKEDYILSCDLKGFAIIWDIQNNYNKKYTFQNNYIGYINDSIILFNILKKNYIIFSSNKKGEFSQLFKLENTINHFKNIYKTDKNETVYLIPWTYKNKLYSIECCSDKISIHNIFEDEIYGELVTKINGNIGRHLCGYIYEEIYLCVSDYYNNYITIWNLTNKQIYKQIKYNSKNGREIMPWNKKYTILACEGCFIIFDIEKEKILEYIKIKEKNYLGGLKKIKLEKYGESLIVSDFSDNIRLFCF